LRKPRAIIVDDDENILDVLRIYLQGRGYEVLSFSAPHPCPIYKNIGTCSIKRPCSDVMLMDYRMPKMSGLDMLEAQDQMGCRLTITNKALMSGNLDDRAIEAVKRLGCASFPKPFDLSDIEAWLVPREQQVDLTQPLELPRKEDRVVLAVGVACNVNVNNEVYQGKALNHGRTGVCIKTSRTLPLRQVVTLQTELPLRSLQAIVRWVREVGKHNFLVGLSC
jgi:CheY-like chemotaxis protein